MKKRILVSIVVAAGLAGLLLAAAAIAQEQGTVYGRVAQWQIARTSWDAYVNDFKKNTVPVMEKLLADGVIIEYGADENNVHSVDGFTHSTWFVARSMAGVEKALAAVLEGQKKMSAEERKRRDTEFVGTKHADLYLRSVLYRTKPNRLEQGYGTVWADKVQPGRGREYRELFEKYRKPVYEQLLADGTIGGYGMDAEQVHTEDPGMRFVWYNVSNAEGLDKVQAAFAADAQKRSQEEQRAITRAFAEVTVAGSHRDSQSRIINWATK